MESVTMNMDIRWLNFLKVNKVAEYVKHGG